MPIPSLFPMFLKAQDGGAPPSGVVGGFIEAVVSSTPRAKMTASPINASVKSSTVRGTLVASIGGRVLKPATAVVGPSSIKAELN